MKRTEIINWLQNGSIFEEGVNLIVKFHWSDVLKRTLQIEGKTKSNVAILKYELCKLAKITDLEIKNITIIKNDIIGSNKIKLPIISISQTSKKQTARELYPNIDWTKDKNVDICYVLIGKQITSYHNYIENHKKLLNATTRIDVNNFSKIIVDNVIENRKCIAELQYYNDKKKFLYKHQYFKDLKSISKYKEMNIGELAAALSNVKTYVSRYTSYINQNQNSPEIDNWKNKLEKYENELNLIQKQLGSI